MGAARQFEDGFRQTVAQAARRFKSTWAELGKVLTQVRDEARFREWGFETFESYCYKELHIRKATALKLTRSFAFLDRHEPEVARAEAVSERAPAFEVVEVLADAEERGALSPEQYRSIRDSIWSGERPTADVRRELMERFPKPVGRTAEGAAPGASRWATIARKLASELAAARHVPRRLVERADALAVELEALVSNEAGVVDGGRVGFDEDRRISLE